MACRPWLIGLLCCAAALPAMGQERRKPDRRSAPSRPAKIAKDRAPSRPVAEPGETTGLPPGCIGATGDCCAPNGTPGCDDPACCDVVCSDDPFCCDTKWDKLCADSATTLCGCSVKNDFCTAAFNVFDGATPFSTIGASTDGPAHDACNFFGDNQVGQDIWFHYDASCTGDLTVTTCEELGGSANYDTRLAIYDTCAVSPSCPDGTLIDCNDDDEDNPCGTPAGGYHSTIVTPVTQGNCYTVRVGGFDLESGVGDLQIGCVPDQTTCNSAGGACGEPNGTPGCEDPACCEQVCAVLPQCCADSWTQACADQALVTQECGLLENNLCADATPVTDGLIPFNTLAATTDGTNLPEECDKNFGTDLGRDIWFTYDSPGPGLLNISTCDDADFDTRIAVYDGCSCPATNDRVAGCDDDGCVKSDPGSVLSVINDLPIAADNCYLIRVGGFQDDAGAGTLELSSTVKVDCPAGTVEWLDPPPGVIDARQPHPVGSLQPLQGIAEITVAAPAAASITCWTVCESDDGGLGPNGIDDVLVNGDGTYTLVLSRPLAPGAVTELRYNGGNTGQFIFHPGNANGDTVSSALDILSLVDFINGIEMSPWGAYSEDIDHSGLLAPADLLALIDLLNGADTHDVWLNTDLPSGPCQ